MSDSGKSALHTGLMHAVIGLTCIAAIAGGFAGFIHFTGDETAGSQHASVGLFKDKPAVAPILKTLADDAPAHGADHNQHAALNTDSHQPSLPVADPGHAASDGPAHVVESSDTHSNGSDVRVRRINTPQTQTAQADDRKPLPRAPIAGFYERGAVGRLPVKASDGRTPAQAYARPHPTTDKPKVSLIVGGLGLKTSLTYQAIADLPPEVTLSFVPYASGLQTWVNRARAAGHEVLLEIPMEPYDYPNVDTGPETLLTTLSEDENERRLSVLLGQTTGYFGLINYQGARLATDSRALTPIMETMERRGLAFFYDGGAPRSVFPSVAEEAALPFFEADRIVDTRPTADAIDKNLLHLEALSLQNGHALGVGFAYPVTVDQFKQWTDTLAYKGYELVPASVAAGIVALDKDGSVDTGSR